MKSVIKINEKSPQPIYRQIIESVYRAISTGRLKKGDKVPSINKICLDHNLGRDTVLCAFKHLKTKGVVISQPGKGYYIASTEVRRDEHVFVLFDEMNSSREDLYRSLVHNLMGKAHVDLDFHSNSIKRLKEILTECDGNYSSYIMIPMATENTGALLARLPRDRVYILDRLRPDLKGYPTVYQDIENDLYEALVDGLSLLKKYRKMVLVHRKEQEPAGTVLGFVRFCQENNFEYCIIESVDEIRPCLYEAWVVCADHDLVSLVKTIKRYKYKLGKKFGILSLSDSPLKEVVAGGITTLSADYGAMGRVVAGMLLNYTCKQVRNPSRLIVRKSL